MNEMKSMSKSTITYRGVVYPWHCDHMGHMNVMWYTGKFDEASWQLLSQLELTQVYLAESGTGMAAVEQHFEYKRELRAGDVITIRSSVIEVKDKALRIAHEMRNDVSGEIAATASVVGVYIDAVIRKAVRLPEEICERALRMREEEIARFLRTVEICCQ